MWDRACLRGWCDGRSWGLGPLKPKCGRRAGNLNVVGERQGPGGLKARPPHYMVTGPGQRWGQQHSTLTTGKEEPLHSHTSTSEGDPKAQPYPEQGHVANPASVCEAKPMSRGRGPLWGLNYGNCMFQTQLMAFQVLRLDRCEPCSSAALSHKRPDQTQTLTRKNVFSPCI